MLDVAIGMVFTFLLLSLICTALGEIAEKYLKYRSTDLERGIRELLHDTLEVQKTDTLFRNKIEDAQKVFDKEADPTKKATAGNNLKNLKYQFALKRNPEEIKDAAAQLKKVQDEVKDGAKEKIEQNQKRVDDAQAKLNALIEKTILDKSSSIVPALYQHSLISGLYRGPYEPKGRDLPSYIPASNFALALLDCVLPAEQDNLSGSAGGGKSVQSAPVTDAQGQPIPSVKSLEPLRKAILSNSSGVLTNPTLRKGLLTLVDSAGNDIDKAKKNIENWFNTSMDRVSGWYKRRTQGILLVMGLLLAIAMNADTIAIYKGLQNDPPLRNALVAASQEYAKAPTSSSINSVKPEDRVDNNAIKLYNLRLPTGWDWGTNFYNKNELKTAAYQPNIDSLKKVADSLKAVAAKADTASSKGVTESLKKVTDLLKIADSLKKVAAIPVPRELTKEEFLSNRKLALPWYYESSKGEDADFGGCLRNKNFLVKTDRVANNSISNLIRCAFLV